MMTNKTVCYILSVKPLLEDNTFDKARSVVSDYRLKKTEKLSKKSDKALCIGAGLLIKYGLSKLGITNFGEYGTYGEKPKLYSNISYSISHSGEYVICTFSESEVGCDVQKHKGDNLKVAKRFFSLSEQALLKNTATDSEKANLFYRIWCIKESYVKALGEGIKAGLSGFSVNFESNTVGTKNYCFFEYNLADDYKCSVCKKTPTPPQFEVIELDKLL